MCKMLFVMPKNFDVTDSFMSSLHKVQKIKNNGEFVFVCLHVHFQNYWFDLNKIFYSGLSDKFNFGLCQSNIKPTLHESQNKLQWFYQEWLIIQKICTYTT
jgi:hypothetical protein